MKSPRLLLILTPFLAGILYSCQIEGNGPFADPATLSSVSCNGHPELCGKKYDQVVFATTHNSYNYQTGANQFLFPNQQFSIRRQLDDGIRGLMIDVEEVGGTLLCFHNFELLGTEPLSVILQDIYNFLVENPNEIISIIFESSVSGIRMEPEFQQAQLVDLVYTHSPGTSWPTLREMINMNRRLVIFTENGVAAGTPAWFHFAWDHIVDTDWEHSSRADFSCDYNRGGAGNNLFLINHWVSLNLGGFNIGIANIDSAVAVNTASVLQGRANDCMNSHSRIPNFLAVDMYQVGDLFQVVDQLNGVN